MRSNEFVFKKTVKRVKKFNGISVDLTVEEAKLLHAIISESPDYEDSNREAQDETNNEFSADAQYAIGDLQNALAEFLRNHGSEASPR